MRYDKIETDFFIKNRKNLKSKLKNNSIAIILSADEVIRNGDQFFNYRQNSDLFYFTGIEQEKTSLVITKFDDSESDDIIFILKPVEKNVLWNGYKLNINDAERISGIKSIYYNEEYISKLDYLIQKAEFIYISFINDTNYSCSNLRPEKRTFDFISNNYNKKKIENLNPIIASLRTIKSDIEINLIKKACSITKNAFYRSLKTIQLNIYEYQIEAELLYEFYKNGADYAYHPIVASGINACTLHYIKNDSICKDGDLLLLDFGAEYANYASDCSRTIPVNGKFSNRQRECYLSVLTVFNKAKKLFVPGNTIENINAEVNLMMEEEMIKLKLFTLKDVKNQSSDFPLFKQYFMHGTSHFLGLDVHDVGSKTEILQKGMLLTCEPGIYIKEEKIGIRLENNILIDDNPIDLMQDIPIEPDEIEQLMQNK